MTPDSQRPAKGRRSLQLLRRLIARLQRNRGFKKEGVYRRLVKLCLEAQPTPVLYDEALRQIREKLPASSSSRLLCVIRDGYASQRFTSEDPDLRLSFRAALASTKSGWSPTPREAREVPVKENLKRKCEHLLRAAGWTDSHSVDCGLFTLRFTPLSEPLPEGAPPATPVSQQAQIRQYLRIELPSETAEALSRTGARCGLNRAEIAREILNRRCLDRLENRLKKIENSYAQCSKLSK
jgi:hypothetical protein